MYQTGTVAENPAEKNTIKNSKNPTEDSTDDPITKCFSELPASETTGISQESQSKGKTRTRTRVEANSLPPVPNFLPFKSQFSPHSARVLLPEGHESDPFSLFSLFFTNKIFEESAENTNRYATMKRAQYRTHDKLQRSWKSCTLGEIKILFGLWIYIGIYKLPSPSTHWERNQSGGVCRAVQMRYRVRFKNRFRNFCNNITVHNLISNSISLVRFEQLKRYFHVSDPFFSTFSDKQWYKKVEPLSSKLHSAFQCYFVPGTRISVDNMMI